jgi:hypothetical protein
MRKELPNASFSTLALVKLLPTYTEVIVLKEIK